MVAKLLTTMLSVKPGRVMAGKGVVDPVGTAMASVALSTIATVLPVGAVNRGVLPDWGQAS